MIDRLPAIDADRRLKIILSLLVTVFFFLQIPLLLVQERDLTQSSLVFLQEFNDLLHRPLMTRIMNLSSVYLVLCLLSSAYSAAIYPREIPFRGLRVKVISVEVTYTAEWAGIGDILHKAIIDGINAQCEEVEGIKFSEVKDSMVKWVTVSVRSCMFFLHPSR
ncbi:hypothetical protein LENED_011302 [Lentinula edodes]|uniref:Uncharacterized protein n=1 Tax=Lentinula edodes TaxID=5353 RepID=A0A1Q3EPN9_LENED|nr:hypothetical protein LENED_011302 [Lentinula edodes]